MPSGEARVDSGTGGRVESRPAWTELWPGPAGAPPRAPALRPGAPLSLMSHHLEGQASPWAL